jgi:RecA/RadA recombinase
MARAIIGGLLSSSLITLVVVPSVYALFERKKLKAEASAVMEQADRQIQKSLGEEPA